MAGIFPSYKAGMDRFCVADCAWIDWALDTPHIWGKQYPSCVKSWEDNWDIFSRWWFSPATFFFTGFAGVCAIRPVLWLFMALILKLQL